MSDDATDATLVAQLRAENAHLRQQLARLEAMQQPAATAPAATTAYTDEMRLFESGPIVIFRWSNREGWPVEWVSANVHQFGYTPNDFYSGQAAFQTIVHPADLARITTEMQAHWADGLDRLDQEYRICAPDGKLFWVYDHTVALRDAQGAIRSYLGYLFDITERKQQDEHRRVLSLIIENARDAVGIGDLDSRLTYANPAFQAMSGYGQTLLGMRVQDLYSQKQESEQAAETLFREGVWQGTLEMVRPDGSRWLGEQSAFVVYDEYGNVVGAANFIRDVTDQQRIEQERVALQQQVIEAQRSALRELSTPLIPIAENVVIMPLIGTIDSARAQQVMETLLEGVATHQATLALIDITGVSTVDTQVAQALVRAARAVRLLGARVMLTGIQPQIAQTIVHLGVDLSDIDTRSSLQAGVAAALRHTS